MTHKNSDILENQVSKGPNTHSSMMKILENDDCNYFDRLLTVKKDVEKIVTCCLV